MSAEDYQQRVIEALAENEEIVGKLYKAYGEKFVIYEQFWDHLAIEEKNHADWIRSMGQTLEGGVVFLNKERFKEESIQVFKEYIEKQLSALANGEVSDRNALAIAVDIESALLEKNFFEVFESDSVEIKNTFNKLARATAEHRERVKRAMEEKNRFPNYS